MHTWISKHPVRFAVYLLLIGGISLGAIDVLLRHCAIGGWLAGQFYPGRYACLEGTCRISADLAGSRFGFGGMEVSAERVRLCVPDLVVVEGATLRRAGARPLVRLDRLELAYAANELRGVVAGIGLGVASVASAEFRASRASTDVAARNLRLDGGAFELKQVAAPGIRMNGDIRIPQVLADSANTALERRRDGSWNLPSAAAAQELASGLRDAYNALAATYTGLTPRIHRALFWILVILTAVVAVVKLALTYGPWAPRVISAGAVVGVAYALFFAGVRTPLVFLIAGVVIAGALAVAIYRKAPEWHQRVEPAAVDVAGPLLIFASLAAYAFVFPALPSPPTRIAVRRLEARNGRVSVRDAALGTVTVVAPLVAVDAISLDTAGPRATVDRIEVTGVNADTSPTVVRASLPQILIERVGLAPGSVPTALVTARGAAEVPPVARTLRDIRYLPDTLRAPAPLSFCVAWKLGYGMPAGCEGGEALSMRGSADAADLRRITYAAESALRAMGIAVEISAQGQGTSVSLTRIRSGPKSALTIGRGSGTVKLDRGVHARIGLADLAASSFQAGAVKLVADASGLRSIQVSAAAERLRTPNGSAGSGSIAGHRRGDRIGASGNVRDLRFSASPWLDGSLAKADVDIAGKLSKDTLDGTLELSTPSFALEPVRFSLSPFAGTLDVPEQSFQLKQTAVSFLAPTIAGRVRADARLRALTPLDVEAGATTELAPQAVSLFPWQTRLGRLRVDAGWPLRAVFDSTVSTVYPSFPTSFELQEITSLKLTSEGTLPGARLDFANPLAGWTIPQVPTELRITGSLGGPVSVTTSQGAIVIGGLDTSIRKLVLRDGRLDELSAHADLRNIRTADGKGELNLATDFALAGSGVSVSGALPGAADWMLRADSQGLHITAPAVASEALWRATEPFLRQFGLNTGGLDPRASVRDIDARLQFAKSRLESGSASLQVLPGPLGQLNKNSAEARAPIDVRLSFTPTSLSSTIVAPSTIVRLEGGGRITSGVEMTLTGALGFSEFAPTPVWQQLSSTATALRPHLERGTDLFGTGDLAWKVAVDKFAFRAGASTYSARLNAPMLDLKFGDTSLSAPGQIAADLVSHRDNLIVDARVTGARFDVPVLAAFTDHFPKRLDKPGLLWDPGEIALVWDGFKAANASAAARVIDRSDWEVGPAVLGQVRIPGDAIRVTIGRADPLPIDIPLSGTVLFGKLSGTGQAEIAWSGNTPSITSRAEGKIAGIQTDAFGLLLQGMTAPLIADEWNADFALRTDGVRLDRDRTVALLRDPASFDQIERVGLRLNATRAQPGGADGYMQLNTSVDLRSVNEVLRRIVRGLAIRTPPQVLRYRDFAFALETDGNRVLAQQPLLTLGGVKWYSSDQLAVSGDLRVHLGPTSVRDLLELIRSLQ